MGESESLFGDSEEIPVQLHVGVFVVDHDDSIAAWSHLKDFRRLSIGDGKASLHDRFRPVARPSGRRGKNHTACGALIVAKPGDVNLQRAERLAWNGGCVVTSRVALRGNLRGRQDEE